MSWGGGGAGGGESGGVNAFHTVRDMGCLHRSRAMMNGSGRRHTLYDFVTTQMAAGRGITEWMGGGAGRGRSGEASITYKHECDFCGAVYRRFRTVD